jgi:hypothetical protein
MMRYGLLVTVSVLLMAGCGTGRKGTTTPKPSGAVVSDPTALSLGGALSYIENTEGGLKRHILPETHLAAVDYKSKLVIVPDKEEIKRLAGTEKTILPTLSPDVRARLQDLPKLIREAEAYVTDAARVLKAVKQAQGSETELSPSEIKRLQREIVQQGKLGERLIKLVKEVAMVRAGARYGDDEAAFWDEVERLTRPLLQDSQGKDVILNVKEFGAFLSEEIDFAMAHAREDVELAEDQGTARFRMWAWLRGQSDWVTVQNYFDAGSFDGPKRPRVALRMTADERERLTQGYETAKEAARFIRDVRDKKSSLRRELATLWKTFQSELENLSALPTDRVLADVNDLLMEAIDQANASSGATRDQKMELARLRAFVAKDLDDDLSMIQSAFGGFKATSSTEFIQAYIAFTADVNDALDAAIKLPEAIATNLRRMKTLMTVLDNMNTAESRALLASLSEQVLPKTKGRLEALVGEQLAQYATLAGKIRGLLTAGQPLNLAEGLDTSRDRPPVRAVELDDILPGTIDVNKTPAGRGDEITIKAELFTTDKTGQETVLQWTEQSFAVDRFGVTSGFSSNLVFVDRQGSGGAGDPDTSFDPAPSASWNLHYRIRPDVSAPWHSKLYRFFDPGFGINTAALDFEDENFQIGVGGHLTLFEDLLIVGYGYNLQAETDHDYWYLGIGVLEALDTVGSLFGAASGSLDRQ